MYQESSPLQDSSELYYDEDDQEIIKSIDQSRKNDPEEEIDTLSNTSSNLEFLLFPSMTHYSPKRFVTSVWVSPQTLGLFRFMALGWGLMTIGFGFASRKWYFIISDIVYWNWLFLVLYFMLALYRSCDYVRKRCRSSSTVLPSLFTKVFRKERLALKLGPRTSFGRFIHVIWFVLWSSFQFFLVIAWLLIFFIPKQPSSQFAAHFNDLTRCQSNTYGCWSLANLLGMGSIFALIELFVNRIPLFIGHLSLVLITSGIYAGWIHLTHFIFSHQLGYEFWIYEFLNPSVSSPEYQSLYYGELLILPCLVWAVLCSIASFRDKYNKRKSVVLDDDDD